MAAFGSPIPARYGNTPMVPTFPRAAGTYTHPTLPIIVPSGALDRWWNYRATKGATRGEFIGFGDSTMWGSGGLYSWLQRLRDRAVGSGMADGGKGLFAYGEDTIGYDTPEINGLVTTTVTGVGDTFDLLGGGSVFDDGSAAGHTVAMQFKGSSARLWYEERVDAGDFYYSLDGGAQQLVHAYGSGGSKFVYLSGLNPAVTHTVTVTNRAGQDAAVPTGVQVSTNGLGSGSLAAGTYYYVVTNTFGGGETLPSVAYSITTGGTRSIALAVPIIGQNSSTIYRGTSAGGPFQLITSTTSGSTTSYLLYTDDGTATPGANPPTVGTTNLNTSAKHSYTSLAPMYDAGFTTQKFARSGQTAAIFQSQWHAWASLGLIYNGGDKTLMSSYAVDTSYAVGARVKPIAALWQLGFNDLTTQSSASTANYVNGVQMFAAMCKVAGVDGIVASGQLPYNANWTTYGAAVYAAIRDTATGLGLAWVDLFTPIGGASLSYSGGVGNPHLTKPQYQTQADWIWDNLLGA